MVSALAAVGVGHGIAGLVNPVASPIIAVGSTLIDAAPTPAKEFAVRTFGTADKPILIGSIGVVLLVFAAVLGLLAWRRRVAALIGISLLGIAGMAAAVARGGLADAVPSLAAGLVGVLALSWLTTFPRSRSESQTGPSAGATTTATSRRGLLLALGATTAVAALGGLGGVALDRFRAAGATARRLVGLPKPLSPAQPLPAGV